MKLLWSLWCIIQWLYFYSWKQNYRPCQIDTCIGQTLKFYWSAGMTSIWKEKFHMLWKVSSISHHEILRVHPVCVNQAWGEYVFLFLFRQTFPLTSLDILSFQCHLCLWEVQTLCTYVLDTVCVMWSCWSCVRVSCCHCGASWQRPSPFLFSSVELRNALDCVLLASPVTLVYPSASERVAGAHLWWMNACIAR